MDIEIVTKSVVLRIHNRNGQWEELLPNDGQFNALNLKVVSRIVLPQDKKKFHSFFEKNLLNFREDGFNTRELETLHLRTLERMVANLCGQFTIIILLTSTAYLISDITRTFPLFYTRHRDGKWYVSDSVESLLTSSSPCTLDEFSVLEFKRAGFVTENRTLINGVRQIEPGTITILRYNDEMSKSYRYFTYANGFSCWNCDWTELRNRAAETIDDAFQDYFQAFQGRVIMLPLSGGYDSRLLACKLKEYGLTDVICYTYGASTSQEVSISYRVAKNLGFNWLFIPYNRSLFAETLRNGVFYDYLKFAHNYSSLPHIQDFFAVYYLRKNNIVPLDSIFLPGHTGDFYSGAHILPGLNSMKFVELEYLAELIYLYHFYLDVHTRKREIVNRLKNQLNLDLGDPYSLVEDWDLRNRQAKYIVNSLRVYEYFGYSHAIPFWHRKLVDFFKQVASEYKDVYSLEGLGKNLYVNTVRRIFMLHNVDFEKDFSKKFKRKIESERSSKGLGKFIKSFREFFKEHLPENVQSIFMYLERSVKKPFSGGELNFAELAELLGYSFYFRRSGILGVLTKMVIDLIEEECLNSKVKSIGGFLE